MNSISLFTQCLISIILTINVHVYIYYLMYNRVSYRTKRLLFEFIREFPISTILLVFDLLSISFICYIDAWDEVLRYGNNNVNYALLESVNRVAYFLKCNIFRENKIHECCGICSDCGICREC